MIKGFIQSGIIDPQDLRILLTTGDKKVKPVDATFVLPGSDKDPRSDFNKSRIDHAVFFDIEKICNKHSPLPHMLPEKETLESHLSRMGIDNTDFLVVYGQHGMVMGPARLWWMMRVFGHDRVCVLDGGLPAWIAAGYDIVTGPPEPVAPTVYTTHKYRPELIADMACVQSASESRECPILDARPHERYIGATPEPREKMRSGHIPNSANIPCSTLIEPRTGKLKSKEDLKTALLSGGQDIASPRLIASCGSGITACMIALALFHLGYETCRVYDGSWSEWGHEDSPTKIINETMS